MNGSSSSVSMASQYIPIYESIYISRLTPTYECIYISIYRVNPNPIYIYIYINIYLEVWDVLRQLELGQHGVSMHIYISIYVYILIFIHICTREHINIHRHTSKLGMYCASSSSVSMASLCISIYVYI